MRDCWAPEAASRPSFKELAGRLKGIKDSGEARTWPVDAMGPQRLEAAKAAAAAQVAEAAKEGAPCTIGDAARVVVAPAAAQAVVAAPPAQGPLKVVVGVAGQGIPDKGWVKVTKMEKCDGEASAPPAGQTCAATEGIYYGP